MNPPRCLYLTIAALTCFATTIARAQDVAPFVTTYRQAVEQDPATARSTWDGFLKDHASDPLADVARLLAGVAVLRAGGDPGEALIYFPTKDAPADASPLRKAAAKSSKVLAAQVKMAALAKLLKAYHAQHVEYPESLDQLVSEGPAKAPDIVDPFGQKFAYETHAKKIAPGMPRQAFTLSCPSIKAQQADLAAALKKTAEPVANITLKSADPASGQAFVRIKRPDGTWGAAQRWNPGEELEGLMLWAAFDKAAIAGWKDFPVVIDRTE